MSYILKEKAQVLNSFLDCLTKEIDIDAVYLFGSHVNGDYNKWSDLDVIIVSDSLECIETCERKYLVASIKNQLSVRLLDIKAVSTNEWENGFGFLGYIRNKVVKWEFDNGYIL